MGSRGAQAASAHRPAYRRRWYYGAFVALLAIYAALTVIVVLGSPMDRFDADIVHFNVREHLPWLHSWVSVLVITGQRGPSTLVALPWIMWRAWRLRSWRPLVLLGTALLILNVTVGAVKIGTGRIGPLHTHVAHTVFADGTIFPSGHVSNAVVLFGVLAWIADRHRKKMIALAVAAPVLVGACTIYLKTHWFSDVIGGWMAGGLVLMLLPWVMPVSERVAAPLIRQLNRLGTRVHAARAADRLAGAAQGGPGYTAANVRDDADKPRSPEAAPAPAPRPLNLGARDRRDRGTVSSPGLSSTRR